MLCFTKESKEKKKDPLAYKTIAFPGGPIPCTPPRLCRGRAAVGPGGLVPVSAAVLFAIWTHLPSSSPFCLVSAGSTSHAVS